MMRKILDNMQKYGYIIYTKFFRNEVTILSYIGGKARMADWISGFVPECDTYVEVFGGAYWVYINSDIHKRCGKAIYNDFNPYMTNLFRCSSHPKVFSKFIDNKKPPLQTKDLPELSESCRDYFYDCKESLFYTDFAIKQIRKILEDKNIKGKQRKALNEALTHARASRQCNNNNMRDVFGDKIKDGHKNQVAAMKYAYILTSSFSGIDPVDSEFQDYKGKYNSKFKAFYNRLTSDKFIPKLKKIYACENMSFEEVIAKYDSPTTYFYVDPPYWSTELYYSLHRFGREQHYELMSCLHNMDGKFSLSYYDFSELSDMYPKDKFHWETKEFVKPAGAKEGVDQSTGEEVLIMNYEQFKRRIVFFILLNTYIKGEDNGY